MMTEKIPNCVHCGRDQNQVPLLEIKFQTRTYQICSEHFPILIHNPALLEGKLPGAGQLTPADHD